jgi:uncharacterized protein YPO0396
LIRKLDAKLDQIGQGVARLKNIALDMNAEIKTQASGLLNVSTSKKENVCIQICLMINAGGND